MLSIAHGNSEVGFLKRKRTSSSEGSDSDDNIQTSEARQKLLVLESEESCATFEDSESCSSFQERETDVPRDTRDSETSIEFTLCSNSETEKGSSSSGNSEINAKKIETIIIIEDVGRLGGSSDSDSDLDTELPKADFWACKCGAQKNNPRFGTCQKCFKARTSHLPIRPRNKARRKREKKASSQSSDGLSSQNSMGLLSQDSQASSSLSQQSQGSDGPKCSVCMDMPVDGIFVHGNSGHEFACYRCSKRIYKDKKRCPICNRAVNNVIRLFKSSLIS